MRTKIKNQVGSAPALALWALLAFDCNSVVANSEETFKVWGNCTMCKKTIEKALEIPGVANAEWDKETKMLTVSFDSTFTKLNLLQKAVANAGYDTEMYVAEESMYESLHECCQYQRKEQQ